MSKCERLEEEDTNDGTECKKRKVKGQRLAFN